jgi:hypothetical protein
MLPCPRLRATTSGELTLDHACRSYETHTSTAVSTMDPKAQPMHSGSVSLSKRCNKLHSSLNSILQSILRAEEILQFPDPLRCVQHSEELKRLRANISSATADLATRMKRHMKADGRTAFDIDRALATASNIDNNIKSNNFAEATVTAPSQRSVSIFLLRGMRVRLAELGEILREFLKALDQNQSYLIALDIARSGTKH